MSVYHLLPEVPQKVTGTVKAPCEIVDKLVTVSLGGTGNLSFQLSPNQSGHSNLRLEELEPIGANWVLLEFALPILNNTKIKSIQLEVQMAPAAPLHVKLLSKAHRVMTLGIITPNWRSARFCVNLPDNLSGKIGSLPGAKIGLALPGRTWFVLVVSELFLED